MRIRHPAATCADDLLRTHHVPGRIHETDIVRIEGLSAFLTLILVILNVYVFLEREWESSFFSDELCNALLSVGRSDDQVVDRGGP